MLTGGSCVLRCAGKQEFLARAYHPVIPGRLTKWPLKLVCYQRKGRDCSEELQYPRNILLN